MGARWVANSTCCLVTTDNAKIVTDPGCNREKLLAALTKEKLSPNDIDFVFLSHQHPDHILLAGLFEKAKFITFDTNLMYHKDTLVPWEIHTLGKDIEIIETPGHVLEHISLIVTTPKGKIGIAGYAIWWLENEKQVFDLHQKDHSNAKGMDMKELVKSRKILIQMSDYIIPGHGKMFKVNKI
jgi:glyoxylase-like metal-dependent hydrolase (beta-lactamase superfamily II)